MIVHQAIYPDLQGIFLRIPGKYIQIGLSIIVIKENRHMIVTALSYVIRTIGDYDTGDFRYVGMIE